MHTVLCRKFTDTLGSVFFFSCNVRVVCGAAAEIHLSHVRLGRIQKSSRLIDQKNLFVEKIAPDGGGKKNNHN
jgi:hypothetical protein